MLQSFFFLPYSIHMIMLINKKWINPPINQLDLNSKLNKVKLKASSISIHSIQIHFQFMNNEGNKKTTTYTSTFLFMKKNESFCQSMNYITIPQVGISYKNPQYPFTLIYFQFMHKSKNRKMTKSTAYISTFLFIKMKILINQSTMLQYQTSWSKL